MTRTARPRSTALLVEGMTDARVFGNLIDENSCFITPTDGKKNALGALGMMRASGLKGVIAALDADFSVLAGRVPSDADVVMTDVHDLEALIIRSPAPLKLLKEYDLAPDRFGDDLGRILATTVVPLGYLRLISLKSGLNLDFKNLDFRQFVRIGPSVQLDVQQMIGQLLQENPTCRLNQSQLQHMIDGACDCTHDPFVVGCGHDMTVLLALMLSSVKGREVQAYTVERQLRLSYEASHFKSTNLRCAIAEWEKRNQPFKVFPE